MDNMKWYHAALVIAYVHKGKVMMMGLTGLVIAGLIIQCI